MRTETGFRTNPRVGSSAILGIVSSILIAATLMAVGSGAATAAQSKPCVPPQTEAVAGWVEIPAPEFPASDDSDVPQFGDSFDTYKHIQAYAVDPVDPRIVVVTNYKTIMLSTDGGCTWKQVYSTKLHPDLPCRNPLVSACNTDVRSILMPGTRAGRSRIYFMTDTRPGHGVVSNLWVTDDFFETIRPADQGLPKQGATWRGPWLSPSQPDVMYLVAQAGCIDHLYKTTDGGGAWQEVTPSGTTAGCDTSSEAGPGLVVTIDPTDPNNLWGQGDKPFTITSSTDGGASWKATDLPISPTAIAVFRKSGQPATVWAFGHEPYEPITLEQNPVKWSILRSTDGGSTWNKMPDFPFEGQNVNHALAGRTPDEVIAIVASYRETQITSVARYSKQSGGWVDITPVIDYYCQPWAKCTHHALATAQMKRPVHYVAANTTFIGSALWRYNGRMN